MKKALSIILSLVLIIGAIFAVPVFSVSAEGAITGFDYANGSWNVTLTFKSDYAEGTSDATTFTIQ